MLFSLLILLGLVIVFAFWAVGIYNGLVTARNAFKNAFARQAFNDSVMAYNNRREVFPGSVVAGMFNFAPAALLEIPQDQQAQVRAAPKVSF